MHHQDKPLIIEALVAYGGDPREQRAWDLDGEDLSTDALVSQIDNEWSGPRNQGPRS